MNVKVTTQPNKSTKNETKITMSVKQDPGYFWGMKEASRYPWWKPYMVNFICNIKVLEDIAIEKVWETAKTNKKIQRISSNFLLMDTNTSNMV